jgi:hypothetical protein
MSHKKTTIFLSGRATADGLPGEGKMLRRPNHGSQGIARKTPGVGASEDALLMEETM